MCGILFISYAAGDLPEASGGASVSSDAHHHVAPFLQGLASRGPDKTGIETLFIDGGGTNSPLHLTFAGSILQLRGHDPVSPPLVNHNSGNILLWNGEIFNEKPENTQDNLHIPSGGNDAEALLRALTITTDIPAVFSSIRGPWACVFWHAETQTLWFGRDVLGRRSLLIKNTPSPETPESKSFVLTSLVPLDAENTAAEGYLEVEPGLYKTKLNENERQVTAVEWQNEDVKAIKNFHRPEQLTAQDTNADFIINTAAVEGVLNALRDAVRVRCHCIDNNPSFSLSLPQNREAQQWQNDQNCKMMKPAKLMILFSGGVDSTLLAALAHESLPPDEPIDLVSICFAQGTSPDREAALSAFDELKMIAPNRPWRLIGANKLLEDVEKPRDRLLRLLYPSDTVMDLNIGAALWLAAAGEGQILKLGGAGNDDEDDLGHVGMIYHSAARCVFLGHGADELFGGYGRHRTRFRNAGWQGLSEELALDVKRLWVRNLGRDDRLVADRGREARHPFLDERVVLQALQCWPLSSLTDLRRDLGVGDKLVLREILRKLGLPVAAGRVKRAIQFGTRLAKVTNAAQFGGTRQANAINAGRVRLRDLEIADAGDQLNQ